KPQRPEAIEAPGQGRPLLQKILHVVDAIERILEQDQIIGAGELFRDLVSQLQRSFRERPGRNEKEIERQIVRDVIDRMEHFDPATEIIAGNSRNLRKINNEIGAAIAAIKDRVRGVANARAEFHDAIVVENGFFAQLLKTQHMVQRLETKAGGA